MAFPKQQLGLHTSRLSSMSPRTYGSLLASSDGGAGSMSRVYKWAVYHNHISTSQFIQQYLGFKAPMINRGKYFYNLYTNLNNV